MYRLSRSVVPCLLCLAASLLISIPVQAQTADRVRTNPDLITAAEIPEGRFASAFELIQAMRPGWLRTRANYTPNGGPAQIMVLVDDARRGTLETLESLTADSIERIEWVDAATATMRWGTGHTHGAIVVTTRRGG